MVMAVGQKEGQGPSDDDDVCQECGEGSSGGKDEKD